MLVTIWCAPSTFELPQSVNRCWGSSECYTAMNCIVLFLNWVWGCQSSQSNLVFNFTNMHAMSYRSDFHNCSSWFNIQEPAICFAVSLLAAFFIVGIPSCLIPTAMSDQKSLNTSLHEIMISFKNDRFLIRHESDRTVKIIFDAWWALINVDLKRPIAWNQSQYAPSWQFYLHCRTEQTGRIGIIWIVHH